MIMLLIFIFGACIGSFLNVVIYRLPQILFQRWTEQAKEWLKIPFEKKQTLSLAFPRSFCPNCRVHIPYYRNIPLLSFIFLKRCMNCKTPIPTRYFIVEALTAILFSASFYHYGLNICFLFSLLFIGFIIPIVYIDYDHQLIPDELNLGLLWFGLIANLNGTFCPINQALYGAIIGYSSLYCFTQGYRLVFKKQAMGAGDFKLFAALGAWFGYTALPLLLFIASCSGVILGISYLYYSKQSLQTRLPFGPFLGISGLYLLFDVPSFIY